MPYVRGTILGFLIGVLPGVGSTPATFITYTFEKKCSKHPEMFGKGAIEGVAAPEAANNASNQAAFVPLLALGIPGSATTAIILGAFMLVRGPAGAIALPEGSRLHLDDHLQHVHRKRHSAHPEFAPGQYLRKTPGSAGGPAIFDGADLLHHRGLLHTVFRIRPPSDGIFRNRRKLSCASTTTRRHPCCSGCSWEI